ncbi:alanine racemase [Haloactinopolyspora alba]|uniref:Alanine racemase n=1 Tax=Haloactinopolyspora alba TaxID=648780 RepID=A0A2P8DVS5_9ACTN|nr:alanine racemase [Haloactinopolyspora alba]PSL01338.1 alanine racemase [Haloactinopolyspora alba]
MPLTLHIDTPRWREHVRDRLADPSGPDDGTAAVRVVPVTKGNGYGFGNGLLAAEAAAADVPTLAVGTSDEVETVRRAFDGDVLVLAPLRPWDAATADDRVVRTVSRVEDLRRLAAAGGRPRVVIELLTSMRRHGVALADLPEALTACEPLRVEGFALHLPLAGQHGAEARSLAEQAFAAAGEHGPDVPRRLWVSHLSAAEAADLARRTAADVNLRVGTALWLGDRAALTARATVIDVHDVRRGDTFGYRQRRARRDGTVAVVAGGTAHGVALEAPTPATGVRQRAVALAKGGLESAGRALSPFRVAGRQRWFAEPPHMQCSMIWLPGGVEVPAVGDEVDVDVRFTITHVDRIAWDG